MPAPPLGPRGVAGPRWHVGPSRISSDYLGLLEDDEFADATFDVGGEAIRAHKAVLAARSSYFRAMLTSSCAEAQPGATIRVHDTTAVAFKRLLAFVYTDDLELDDAVVVDVLRKAEEYQLERAYSLCMRHCVRHVGPTNAVTWLIRASLHRLDDLYGVALRYVRHHFREIRETAVDSLAELRAHPDLMLEVMVNAL